MYAIDLLGFEDFMQSRNLVAEKYRSFYVRWVRRFLQSEFNARALAEQDKVVCYLDQLGRDGAVKEMRELLRLRHYAYRTEQTYMDWVERYLDYTGRQSLDWKHSSSVQSFLSHLALKKNVASSTQNQALNALIFFFRETLKIELDKIDAVRAKRGKRLPTVLSVEEVKRLLDKVRGPKGLMLRLTYGGGLRVSETIRLRAQDLDFENNLLFVRSGKGDT